jgi:hypothetical protein
MTSLSKTLSIGTISAAYDLRCGMQRCPFSRHKFFLLCMVFCGALLASSHDARALSIGDSHELGFIWPGMQKKTVHQNKVIYLNHLIGMALGTIDIANGEVYFRANNVFESLPAAGRARNGGGRMMNLGTAGLYTYLFATYNGYGTEVWYVGNLNGIITIPFLADGHHRHYLTGWTLFGPRSVGVPDGGLTVTLLGVALAGLALTRRFVMR